MSSESYQRGMEKFRELTVPDDTSPTGHMDIGEVF